MPIDPEREPQDGQDGLLRFNLAMQRSRAFVYIAALAFGTLAIRAGVLRGSVVHGFAIVAAGVGSAIVFYYVYKARLDRAVRWNIHWIWLLFDTAAVTAGVHMSGGVSSPWYLFYLAISACAASKTASYCRSSFHTSSVRIAALSY